MKWTGCFQHHHKVWLMGLVVMLFSGCSHYGHHEVSKTAKATIQGCTDSEISGTATLREFTTDEGIKKVYVQMEVKGLTDGEHAVHIHEVASCQPCGAAQGHHDPGPFGKSTPDAPDFNHPYHMGDFGQHECRQSEWENCMPSPRVSVCLMDG